MTSSELYLLFLFQDMAHDDIPIMLVGNKCDLRQDGDKSVPTSYGQKLAMVDTNKMLLLHLTCNPLNPFIYLAVDTFVFITTCIYYS